MDQMREDIASALADFAARDKQLVGFYKTLTSAERVQIGFTMTEVDHQNAVANLRRRHPWLSEQEALRMVHSGHKHFLWERHES